MATKSIGCILPLAKHGTITSYQHGCHCVECRAAQANSIAVWRANNHDHAKAYKRNWDQAVRKEVTNHYGGVCVCCGESRLPFLSLDHKRGGGSKHRKELGLRGAGMCAWAKREGFPDIFQIMCHNCNQAIGFYGACPHKDE